MAYNAVPTVATGDPWSAANHNTYIRDNFAAGVPDIFTAAGQLAYATGANAAAALATGVARKILRMNSAANAPEWAGAIVTRVARTGTAQVISHATETDISWNSETYDTDGLWAAGSPTVFTIPYAGYWHIEVEIRWAANATGYREVKLQLGAGTTLGYDVRPGTSLADHIVRASADFVFGATNTVRAQVAQTSGGNLNVNTSSWMSAFFVGP
jgi:hypothetical protein